MAIIKVKTGGITADAVTDALIADDVVGTEHLTANEVDTTALGADAVTGAQLADDAVNSEHYTDGSVDTAHIADAQITTAKLSTAVFTGATDIGAAIVDADLFLMDDGAGGTIRKTTASRIKTYAGSANTPAFELTKYSGTTTLTNDTVAKVTFDTEFDPNSTVSSNRFTPGIAGRYFIYGGVKVYGGGNSGLIDQRIQIYKNGSAMLEMSTFFADNYIRFSDKTIQAMVDMDTDDYVELYFQANQTSGSPVMYERYFGGFKIIQ